MLYLSEKLSITSSRWLLTWFFCRTIYLKTSSGWRLLSDPNTSFKTRRFTHWKSCCCNCTGILDFFSMNWIYTRADKWKMLSFSRCWLSCVWSVCDALWVLKVIVKFETMSWLYLWIDILKIGETLPSASEIGLEVKLSIIATLGVKNFAQLVSWISPVADSEKLTFKFILFMF